MWWDLSSPIRDQTLVTLLWNPGALTADLQGVVCPVSDLIDSQSEFFAASNFFSGVNLVEHKVGDDLEYSVNTSDLNFANVE